MANTQFNIDQFKTEAVKPLYAVAGATELAVEYARGYAQEAQKVTQARIDSVQARLTKADLEPKNLQTRARTLVNTRVEDLQAQAKDAQAKFETRLKDLQADTKDLPATFEARLNDAIEELNSTYADLTKRGEKFVAAVKKDGLKAVAAVKPARRKPAKKAAAKQAPARKPAAKKAPARKAVKKSA